jgi:uncharacterized delta-60 repeat protein
VYVTGVTATTGETTQEAVMSFSADGKTPVPVAFSASDDVHSVRVLADGSIVGILNVEGETPGTQFKVFAYNSTTKAYSATAITSEILSNYDFSDTEIDQLLFSQVGNKIVIEGRDTDGMTPVLVRLNANGTVDTTFGDNGYFTVPEEEEGETYNFMGLQISVLADGKLLATGIKQTTLDGEVAIIARLTADGKFDTTFGVNGILSSEPGEGGVDFRVLSNGAIIQVDGSLEGSSVTMFSKDGKLDPTFGSDPAGADSLVGGAGNDTLVSGAGVTTMDGGLGDDWYVVNNSADVIRESTLSSGGVDTVVTTVSYTLGGGLENLGGSDTGLSLTGNALANSIEGGKGNDTIFLGANDTVDGIDGNDLYILNDTLTAQTIHLVKMQDGVKEFRDTLQSAVSFDLRAALYEYGDHGRVMNVDNLVYTSTLGGNLRGTGWDGISVGNKGNDTLSD